MMRILNEANWSLSLLLEKRNTTLKFPKSCADVAHVDSFLFPFFTEPSLPTRRVARENWSADPFPFFSLK